MNPYIDDDGYLCLSVQIVEEDRGRTDELGNAIICRVSTGYETVRYKVNSEGKFVTVLNDKLNKYAREYNRCSKQMGLENSKV